MKFKLINGLPDITCPPIIVHWPGNAKPIPNDPYGYHGFNEPMTFFRKQYLRDSTTLSEYEIERKILKEEIDRIKKIKRYENKFGTR